MADGVGKSGDILSLENEVQMVYVCVGLLPGERDNHGGRNGQNFDVPHLCFFMAHRLCNQGWKLVVFLHANE